MQTIETYIPITQAKAKLLPIVDSTLSELENEKSDIRKHYKKNNAHSKSGRKTGAAEGSYQRHE